MALEWKNYTFIGENFAQGGINLKSAVTNVADNESPECKNVIFQQEGAIQKRRGYSKLNLEQIPLAPTVTGIYQLQKSDGTSCVIIGAGADIFHDANTPVSVWSGQTPGALYDFAALNDYAFLVDGVDPNLKDDCNTVTFLGIDPPGVAPSFSANIAGTNLDFPGNYQYVYTFVDADGFESNPSPASAVIPTAAGPNQDLQINIGVSADPQVVDRNVYRTINGGVTYFLVGAVGDNVALTFDDHIPDADLGVEVEFDNDKPPIFKYIETHANAVFGVEAANPNRLRFSKQFNHQAWPILNFIDVSPDDGDVITGIVSFFDQLVVFKRETIYVLSGTDATNFVLQRAQTDSRVGAVAHRSIVVLDNRVAFLSERGIYTFDGLRTQYVSANLEGIFDKNNPNQARRFNWAQETISCASNYKNKSRNWYFLAVPTGSSLENNLILVLDYQDGNWTLFTGIFANALAICEEQNEPRLYSGDYNGFLWKQDDTDNDGFQHYPSFSTSNANGPNTLRDETQATLLGTATAGGANTLTDASLSMGVNAHVGKQLYIEAGTGAGQVRTVASNTSDTFTVSVPWGVVPDATSEYVLGGWDVNAAIGVRVKILDGQDAGDIRTITANTPVEFTVDVNWTDIPDTTSEYSIGFIEGEWQSRWFHYNAPEFVKRLRYVHVNANREGDYPLVVGLRFDFFTGDINTVLKSLQLSGADSVWDQSLWDVDSWDQVSQTITRISNDGGRIHRYVQFLFRNEAGDQPFTVNSTNLVYQVKGVRR